MRAGTILEDLRLGGQLVNFAVGGVDVVGVGCAVLVLVGGEAVDEGADGGVHHMPLDGGGRCGAVSEGRAEEGKDCLGDWIC